MRRLTPISAAFAAAVTLSPASRADVPFFTVYLSNAVEVTGQDKFPEWIVLVFPSAPPSGRPAAWPALVEPGFHTEIDRKVLGAPKLWILERAALDDLKAAAKDNDDKLDGPVAKLLRERGVECATLKLEEKASLPGGAPIKGRLYSYALEDAAKGRCAVKLVKDDFWEEEYKRSPSWASFGPKKKASAAASASASPAAPASATPPATASGAAVSAPSAAPAASASASPAPAREAPVPEPSRAKGCGCVIGDDSAGTRPLLVGALFAISTFVMRRARLRRARP